MNVSDLMSEYESEFVACDEFARTAAERHDDAVLKIGRLNHGPNPVHCYVYLADEDVTLDPTLSQFDAYCGILQNDWFIGDDHPHVTEVAEAETVDEFDAALEAEA
jgi:hypothetical protein